MAKVTQAPAQAPTQALKAARAPKTSKASKAPNAALHSRVSYLHQAAVYLALEETKANRKPPSDGEKPHLETRGLVKIKEELQETSGSLHQSSARRIVSDLRGVGGKVLIRMSPAMKQSICRNCDTLLFDGSTCSVEVENKSKGGKKPWADVLVRKCCTCGYVKRYPLGERQKRRPHRAVPTQDKVDVAPEFHAQASAIKW